MAQKPRVFRWRDLFWLGLALAFTIPIVIIHVNGLNEIVWWRSLGMFAIVVFAWTFWPTVLLWRWRFIRRIAYITKHGLLVVPNEHHAARLLVEEETERVLRLWRSAIPDATVDGTYVVFKPLPFELHTQPGRFAGFAIPWKRTILVGFRLPLQMSALGHELGHQILANAQLPADEATLRDYHLNYNVPY